MAEKMDFGPTGKDRGAKMAEKWENWSKNRPKIGQKWPFSIFQPFFPLFPGGAKIHFSAIFFPFRAGGPTWGLYRAIGIASKGHKLSSSKLAPSIVMGLFGTGTGRRNYIPLLMRVKQAQCGKLAF